MEGVLNDLLALILLKQRRIFLVTQNIAMSKLTMCDNFQVVALCVLKSKSDQFPSKPLPPKIFWNFGVSQSHQATYDLIFKEGHALTTGYLKSLC